MVRPSRPDYEVIGTFNPGVARLGQETILLLRVAERPINQDPAWLHSPRWNARTRSMEVFRVRRDDPELTAAEPRLFVHRGLVHLTSISHLRLARSTNGITFTVSDVPSLAPSHELEGFGIEDCRITCIDGTYWVAHKAVSRHGVCVRLGATRDFVTFEPWGTVFCPHNLDVVIFPRRIRGEYVALCRPESWLSGVRQIWVARSPDLFHWGGFEPLIAPRTGMWDSARVGAGAVPILTDQGWLLIYHGADEQDRYGTGVALLDGTDPSRVIKRSPLPVLTPQAPYERSGFFGNVVFVTGAAARGTDELLLYYGAADESTCAARTSVAELLSSLA